MEDLGHVFEKLLKDHPDAVASIWVGWRFMYWDSQRNVWAIFEPVTIASGPTEIYSSPNLGQALDRLQNLPKVR